MSPFVYIDENGVYVLTRSVAHSSGLGQEMSFQGSRIPVSETEALKLRMKTQKIAEK